MFDALNENIDKGATSLNNENNDDTAQLDDKNKTLAILRTNINDRRKNEDTTKVVTITASPNKVVHIHLH